MATFSDALKQRTSIRAYLKTPVPESLLREIVDVARWAPSGGNLQPWGLIALAGPERDAVVALAKAHMHDDPDAETGDDASYPANLWEPYRSRRYKNGEDMYAAAGIPREDKPARLLQLARNYDFFGAPVGIFFTIDRAMGRMQWTHLGMFIVAVSLAAQERGLSTCMQGFWLRFRETVHRHLQLSEQQMIYCGMALGYADPDAPINSFRSERAEVDEIAEFRGFAGD